MDDWKPFSNKDYNLKRIDKQYFIDRRGKVHKYKGNIEDEICSIHNRIADDLFPKVMGNAQDYIMQRGWILIGSCVYSTPISKKKPTQAQINKLFDLGLYEKLCVLLDGFYRNFKDNEHLFY